MLHAHFEDHGVLGMSCAFLALQNVQILQLLQTKGYPSDITT